MSGKKFIHLSFSPVGDDGSFMERRIEFDSEADMVKFIAAEKKEKQDRVDAFKASLLKMKEENKGSIRLSIEDCKTREKWSNPGKNEVKASVDTFDVSIAQLQKELVHWDIILDLMTGAPEDIDSKYWLDRARSAAQGSPDMNIEKAAAMLWLHCTMELMHVREEVRDNILQQAQSLMSNDRISTSNVWSKVIGWYNGFVKTGWEAVTFGPDLVSKSDKKGKKRKRDSAKRT